MINKNKYDEWFFQSDYDLETAVDMLKTGRNVYCIFMCHLSLEKALKGLMIKKTNIFPPKSHSLIFLLNKIGLEISEAHYEFLFTLNKVSVPTRYPEDLRQLFSSFSKERTLTILDQTKEVQSWIKKQ